tara:strand:+ start:233 stop:1120 length:888 start_codon:yes stop_codon:yes gene_type:complete
MKIIVIGENSQLGKELTYYSRYSANNYFYFNSESMNFLNISNVKEKIIKCNPDLVINFSAYTNVEEAETDKELCFQLNSHAPMEIAKICKSLGVCLIHISTDYVFGGDLSGPFTNKSPTSPINTYGLSKLEGEKNIIKHNEKSIIIRTASVFSVHNNNFVKNITKKILSRSPVKVVEDQNISITYAKDLSYFIYKIIEQNQINYIINTNSNNIVHFTNLNYTTWFEVANHIFNELNLSEKKYNNIIPVTSKDWISKAPRPYDSRLALDYDLLSSLNIEIVDWKRRVSKVLKELDL